MKNKKLILLLFTLLTVLCFSLSVSASDDAFVYTVEGPTSAVNTGDVITLKVNINENSGIRFIKMKLEFNPEALEYVAAVENATLFSNITVADQNASLGYITITIGKPIDAIANNAPIYDGTGTAVVFTFKALDDFDGKVCPTISVDSGNFFDKDGKTGSESSAYTATGESSEFYLIDTDTHVHVWAGATCEAPKTCTLCGTTDGEALGHAYPDSWTTNGDGTHSKVCANDPTHVLTENCTGGVVDCENEAVCEVCNGSYQTELGHDYGDWVSNGDGTHTKTCSREGCPTPTVTEACSGGTADCENAAVCTACNGSYGEALGHNYADATCTAPKTCEDCGATDGEALSHNYADATCTAPKTCKDCGATDGEALGHNYADATCTAPKTCEDCGATDGEALCHNYADATCTAPKTCEDCGATDGEALGHNYADATCTAPKTCEDCGATDGEALGHNYADATCTAPKTCKDCGATDGEALSHNYADATCTAPKTCKDCGATDGEALSHNYADATCTAPKTCKDCGATDGEALGHTPEKIPAVEPTYSETGSTEGSKCSVCGEILEAPEVVAEKSSAWIWITVIASVVVIAGGGVAAFFFIKKKKQ